jgi:hypothetical protein
MQTGKPGNQRIEEYLNSKYRTLQIGSPDFIRIVLNLHNVILPGWANSYSSSFSEMSNIKCAVSERVNKTDSPPYPHSSQ